jgi:hypothetical protein
LALVANQVRQDFEFSRSQSKILARTPGCPRYEVEFEILDPKHSLLNDDGAASGQRLDASEQLREGKWLDKIVIASSPQTADPIVDLAECTQDQSRRDDPVLSQLPNHGYSIEAGKHTIDRHHDIIGRSSAAQRCVGVRSEINLIAVGRERIRQLLGRHWVVLDNENAASRSSHRAACSK